MKFLLFIAAAVPVLFVVSCETTTIVKPEPTTVSETHVRRTATSTGYGVVPETVSTTETRTVTAQ